MLWLAAKFDVNSDFLVATGFLDVEISWPSDEHRSFLNSALDCWIIHYSKICICHMWKYAGYLGVGRRSVRSALKDMEE